MKKPKGKKHNKAFADKWFAYVHGDSKAKEGVRYRNVFLEKIKKHSKIKKNISYKTDKNPVDVSTMNRDEKPNNDVSKDIHIGGQVGMPEEVIRITFANFRKQTREINYGRGSI